MLTRNLDLRRGRHTSIIRLRVSVPRKRASGDWSCRLSISGIKTPVRRAVWGIDSVQSAQLALQLARQILEREPGTITFNALPLAAAFPLTAPSFGPKLLARSEAALRREQRRWERELDEDMRHKRKPRDSWFVRAAT